MLHHHTYQTRIQRLKHALETEHTALNINEVLDDFLHVLADDGLNTNDQFESIYNELGGFCDINTCTVFTRTHRDRTKPTTYDSTLHVNQQIVDTIHCFFSHSFDIGFRINSKDKTSLNTADDEAKSQHKELETPNILTNQQTTRLCAILRSKHESYRKISSHIELTTP
eukprot:792184_1